MAVKRQKKEISIRNIIIVLLLIVVILLSFGFSFISSKYDDLKNKEIKYNVIFKKLKQKTPIRGGVESPIGLASLSNDGKTINFNTTLFNNYDELTYTVVLVNDSSIPVKIINLIQSPNYSGDAQLKSTIYPIEIEYDNIYNKTLLPKEKVDIEIKILYNNMAQTTPLSKSASFSLSVLANGV